jgi:hypothetical protein
MRAILQTCLLLAAIPFLALVGLLFFCLRKTWFMMGRIVGLEIVWPPVLVADLEETNQQLKCR